MRHFFEAFGALELESLEIIANAKKRHAGADLRDSFIFLQHTLGCTYTHHIFTAGALVMRISIASHFLPVGNPFLLDFFQTLQTFRGCIGSSDAPASK